MLLDICDGYTKKSKTNTAFLSQMMTLLPHLKDIKKRKSINKIISHRIVSQEIPTLKN